MTDSIMAPLVRNIATGRIGPPPHPARHLFDEQSLAALTASIRESGLLQPLCVCRAKDGYTLVCGERRLLAAKRAGLKKVPCFLVRGGQKELLLRALLSNLQRDEMNCFEIAECLYALLADGEMCSDELCRRTGLTSAEVERKLRLLRLGARERIICEAAGMSEKRAQYILSMPEEERRHIFADLLSDELCLGEKAQLLCERLGLDRGDMQRRTVAIKDVRIFFNTIDRALAVMKQAGVEAQTQRRDGDEYVEYCIRIPSGNVLTRY
ncbi:MAG: ParB/RepB/Spo0J family partition protein [Oscillospiraceae bacterium]|nr:ParB/RepB/Spo0J family partition protein [Oscillospiraceae bacterium]